MNDNPRTLAIIPARGGSKGIPNKNILKIGNKPLIHYTINRALESKLTSKIIVSSDSKEILDCCRDYKGIELNEIEFQDINTKNDINLAKIKFKMHGFIY